MQLIENDMDDLFRRAATHYSLDTAGSDWEKVAAQVGVPSATKSAHSISYGKLFTLVLLGLFVILPFTLYSPFRIHSPLENTVTNEPLFSSAGFVSSSNRITPATLANGTTNRPKAETETGKPTNRKLTKAAKQNNEPTTNRKPKRIAGKLYSQVTAGEWADEELLVDPLTEMNKNRLGWIAPAAIVAKKWEVATDLNQLTFPSRLGSIAIDTVETNLTRLNALQKEDKKYSWYVGLIGGPQYCEVKRQGFSKTGFDIGILAGYRLNKQFSLEAGLSYSNKKYFSDGKYFDKLKASSSMPITMKVLSLEGNSQAIELFTRLKYELFHYKKTSWFISSGISAHMLTKETNNYLAIINGISQHLEVAYNKGSVAASWYLGASVNVNVFKSTSISISPYVQLPLNGIGVGALPVSTSGLQIGITLPIRKK